MPKGWRIDDDGEQDCPSCEVQIGRDEEGHRSFRLMVAGMSVSVSLLMDNPMWSSVTPRPPSSSGTVQWVDSGAAVGESVETIFHTQAETFVFTDEFQWGNYLARCLASLTLDLLPVVLLHAATLAVGDVALVLLGPSRSGKSTLASALHREGAVYFGDDSLFLRRDSLELVPICRPPLLREGGVALLGADAPPDNWVQVRPGERKLIAAVDSPDRPLPTKSAVFIFMQGFAQAASMVPLTASETLRRLSPTVCGKLSFVEQIDLCARVADRFPSFCLTSGEPVDTARLVLRKVGALAVRSH